MARKPRGEAPFAAFGALLTGHLRAGRRPDPDKREPWSDTAFAKTQPGQRDAASASPRTVANWRKGTSLPSQIEPILRALFGPLRSDGGAERAALRAAYLKAKEPEDRRIVAGATPDPAGESFVVRGAGLAINRAPSPDDSVVAATAELAEEHAEALRNARRLVDLTRRRGNSLTDAWSDLLEGAGRFLAAIDRPTQDLPGVLAAMYQASVGLGALLEQDGLLRERPEDSEQPLPADLRRVLAETVTSAVLLSRAFPSNQARDGRVRDFWRRENLPAAREVVAETKAEDLLPAPDVALIEEIAADGERPGTQGDKAKGRLFATLRNMALAGFTAVMLSGYANESPLVKRISGFLVRVERPLLAVMEGAPPDLTAAIRNGVERMKDAPGDGPPVGIPAGGPAPGARREPPPEFDFHAVKLMILAGQAPPAAWVPFITELNFDGEALRDLEQLRGLVGLQSLSLANTQIHDLKPLRGLTELQSLSINNTPVSDLDPLRGLAGLQFLWLNNTKVRDLTPLRALLGLSWLSLDGTEVSDLDPLRELKGLRRLDLDDTAVSALDPLASLADLQRLSLNNTHVTNLDPLRGLNRLIELALLNARLSDLEPLRGLSSLQSLHLSGTRVTDLEPMRSLTELETLRVNSTEVKDLEALRGLTKLKALYMSNTLVKDLDPLRDLKNLIVLDCELSPVVRLAALEALPKLRVLRVNAALMRKSPNIDRLKSLRFLYLSGEMSDARKAVTRPNQTVLLNDNSFEFEAQTQIHEVIETLWPN